MPRYGRVTKRKLKPDAVYNNLTVAKFINCLMYDGKKSKAETIIYGALTSVAETLKVNPIEVFEKVITSVSPLMEVKSRRVGGATYQVPIEVTKERGQALGMRWLRDSARDRSGRSMIEKLTAEMLDAYKGIGSAMKKREDMHKTAEGNRAFAHFRW